MQVILDEQALAALCAHAQARAPEEACGVLGGPEPEDGTPLRLDHFCPVTNLDASPDRFTMDPVDLVRAERSLAAAGRHLVAAFHSHPARAPQPSEADRAAAWPNLIQLILGGALGPADLESFVVTRALSFPLWTPCAWRIAATPSQP